ncbi:PREDICTED: NEDD4 family-interacting protein 2 [Nipponia nippon]|uniref:NEDD4 family-interacting protein 2 n=1 Tax=Nipponia nippon TaxID=128390 RepID=UPI00051163B9|nr:PREDICTED: NEDD4 family-interacting protein 2 [Nipponia nippon]
MPFSPSRQWRWETCRKRVRKESAEGTGTGTEHPGKHPHVLVTKSSLAELLESSGAEQVTRLVEFLIERRGELFEEEVAGLAAAPAEESPAPGAEAETAEVPLVAPESEHLKSSSEESRCRFAFAAWIPQMSSDTWASRATMQPPRTTSAEARREAPCPSALASRFHLCTTKAEQPRTALRPIPALAGGLAGSLLSSGSKRPPAGTSPQLHNEDDPPESSAAEQPSTSTETTQTPQTAALSEADTSPPPYCSIAVEAAATSETHNEFYPVPPPYSVATSLPTYDEAEKAKAAAMAAAAAEVAQRHAQFRESRSLFDEIFLSRPEEEEYPPRDDFSDADQLRVGNDGIFMLAFFMAFIFNWIGFCLSFCITNTIAGRYGAICGFGLSLIKWILIVRFSDYFTGYFNGQYWLWWIFLVLGLLLFFRGFVNYLKVRNMSESMAAAHRTRFFFLY